MTFTHSNVPWPGYDARYDMDEEWVLVDVKMLDDDGPAMVPSPPSGPREATVSAPSFALDEAKMDEDMAPPPTDEPAVASAVAPSNHLEHEHKLALMEEIRALKLSQPSLTAKQLHKLLSEKHGGASLAVVKRCASAVHKRCASPDAGYIS